MNTIVVLLILAGVSLSLVAGGDGIIAKADKAVSDTNVATAQDAVNLAIAGMMMDYYSGNYLGGTTFDGDLDQYINSIFDAEKEQESTKVKGYIIETNEYGNITVKDKKGKTITTGAIQNGGIAWEKVNDHELGTAPIEPDPDTYAIKYNANGGSGTMASTTANVGENVTLASNGFTKEGFTFAGWAKEANKVDYKAGESVSALSSSKDDEVTLYAMWTRDLGKPVLQTGLTPVTLSTTDGSYTDTNIYDASWYDYTNQKWANARTADGSLWVWIPRYEYKINTTTNKTFDVNIITTSKTTPTSGYKIHPAFTNGASKGYANGEWDKELSGMWVAKFPAGYQQNTIDTSGKVINDSDTLKRSTSAKYTYSSTSYATNPVGDTLEDKPYMTYPVFKGMTFAYNNVSIGESYSLARALTEDGNPYGLTSSTDSHQLKNSEWGAVAYFTQSQYGRNGVEPYVNAYYKTTSSPYTTAVTGNYATDTTSKSLTTLGNAWYTTNGVGGSSTGNISGVYDLNGCVWERVSGFIANSNGNLATYGGDVFSKATASTKYATVYPYDNSNSSSDTNANNWTEYKKSASTRYGDAILETSTAGNGSYGWYSDYSYFPYSTAPFFVRGGYYNNGSDAGAFAFNDTDGGLGYGDGFRAVLVVE